MIARLSLVLLALAACRPTAGTRPPQDNASTRSGTVIYPALVLALDDAANRGAEISDERKQQLDAIATLVRTRRAAGAPARLLFVCTGNSRRSQLAQLWAAAAASYHGVEGIESHSGGLEPSRFDHRAIAALERAGFVIEATTAGDNPHFRVQWADGARSIEAFSKRFDDPSNPSNGFIALMVCSDADEACPAVAGATERLSLPYDDPKLADGTPEEQARYDERSKQIAAEMVYLFGRAAAANGPT